MLSEWRAIEFDAKVQDANAQISILKPYATALGLGDDAPVIVKIWDANAGEWLQVDDQLRSGKEGYTERRSGRSPAPAAWFGDPT